MCRISCRIVILHHKPLQIPHTFLYPNPILVATEDLVLLFDKMGFETGIDLEKLWAVADSTKAMVGKETGGRTKAWWVSEQQKACA